MRFLLRSYVVEDAIRLTSSYNVFLILVSLQHHHVDGEVDRKTRTRAEPIKGIANERAASQAVTCYRPKKNKGTT